MKKNEFLNIFRKYDLPRGRLITASKSSYIKHYYEDDIESANNVMFNTTIFTQDGINVWSGDLDLNYDKSTLKSIAEELDTTLFVINEHKLYLISNSVSDQLNSHMGQAKTQQILDKIKSQSYWSTNQN